MMNETVFLFATHKLTDFVLEQYYRLKLATKNIGVLYLLIEDGELQQIPVDVNYYSFSVRQLRQMPEAPAYKVAVSRKIAVVAFGRAQHGGDGLGDGGLFRNH